MPVLNVPAFEPDRSRFAGSSSASTLNALPVADGWGPMPSYVAVTPDGGGAGTALSSECLGAYHARTASGNERYFAFTASAIYEFNTTTFTWADVSGPAAPYSTAERWSIVQFGPYIIAQNGTDAEQYIDVDSGTAFASNATAPIAKYLAVVGDFVVRGNISGAANKVQWSAINNFQSNTGGVDGSSSQILAVGEQVQGIVPVTGGAVIIMQDAIHAMNLTFDQWVFTFQLVSDQRGCPSPYSIATINQNDFVFFSNNGFVRGSGFQEIGAERVDAWFMNTADSAERAMMNAMVDPNRKIVWWRFKTTDSTVRMLGYDWSLDRWCYSNLQIAEMFSARTIAISIDAMDTLYGSIDEVDEAFDSLDFDIGTPQLAVVTASGYLAFLNGANQEATIEWNEVSFAGSARAMVNGARLIGDAVNPTVTLSTADYHGGDLTPRTSVTPSSRTRFLPIRGDGRVHKVKAVIPAGEEWTIVSGIDVDVKGTGRS